MKKILAVAVVLLMAVSAQAAVINVNILQHEGQSGTNVTTVGPSDPGYNANAGGYWNNVQLHATGGDGNWLGVSSNTWVGATMQSDGITALPSGFHLYTTSKYNWATAGTKDAGNGLNNTLLSCALVNKQDLTTNGTILNGAGVPSSFQSSGYDVYALKSALAGNDSWPTISTYAWTKLNASTLSGATFDVQLFPSASQGRYGVAAFQIVQVPEPAMPSLTASPVSGTPIDFGHLAASTASTTSKITLSNTGEAGSTIDVTSGAFGDGALFSFDPAYSDVTLTAGGAISSMDYLVKFNGSATPGLHTDTLTFLTSAGNLSYAVSATVDEPLHPGDANGDGTVNFLDYNIVKTNYLSSSVGWAGGDLNGDGVVNFLDYNIVKTHYLHTSATIGVQAIPEPATMSMLILGGMAALIRRRNRR